MYIKRSVYRTIIITAIGGGGRIYCVHVVFRLLYCVTSQLKTFRVEYNVFFPRSNVYFFALVPLTRFFYEFCFHGISGGNTGHTRRTEYVRIS